MKFLTPLCMLLLTTLVTGDVDQCSDPDLNDCTYNSNCVNTGSSYQCSCKEGYYQDPSDNKNCLLTPCEHPLHMDIIFYIDNAIESNYQFEFIKLFVRALTLGPDDVQVAVANPHERDVIFYLNDYTNYDAIDEALSNYINFNISEGNTRGADVAIVGRRPDVAHLLIQFYPVPPETTDTSLDVMIYLLEYDRQQYPVFIAQSYEELETKVASYTCSNYGIDISCENRVTADIIFIIDSSESVGIENYNRTFYFVDTFVRAFTVGPDDVQIAALTYSTSVDILFDLKDFTDYDDIKGALLAANYLNGSTYTHKALKWVSWYNMFGAEKGGRADADKLIILLTDGQSNRRSRTIQAANDLKSQGVTIISIGVGPDVDQSELTKIASFPDDVFHADSYDVLDSIEANLVQRACSRLDHSSA